MENREKLTADVLGNARAGYQASVALWTFENQLAWARFSGMLTANSVITAVTGLILTCDSPVPCIAQLLPITGLVLCLVWSIATARGRSYAKYWILCSREMERFLCPVQTVQRGSSFAHGDEVQVAAGTEMVPHRLPWLVRRIPADWVFYVAIAAFAVLHSLLLIFAHRAGIH